MSDSEPFDPETVIDAMAPMLGLDVKPEYRPGIAANLNVTARFATLLLAEPIADHAEPAEVFRP